ncbi:uncharacterized protein LOC135708697 [Ochlerotatus camptorhynchus]|uniref:uncharacterized protein LOC135708697 n=1 Tax=Ochlerotatus camptorhynchus TaxID=644619 RepID=UPI0031D5CAE0
MVSDGDKTVDQQPTKIPDWLNETFFEDIFVEKQRLDRGKFKVKINSTSLTGGAGENYTSTLYRANVDAVCDDGSIKSLIVIIKTMITAPEMKTFSVFTREKHFYEETLPAMERMWAEAGETVRFGPRCWKTNEGEADTIVLDDLGAEGYSVGNRHLGANLEHVHILLAKLAKFHAAGATHYRKNETTSSLYDNILIKPNGKEFMEKYLNTIAPVFLESLSTSSGHERYIAKLEKSTENVYEKLSAALTKDDSGFVTLCHGDVWTNNHMYSYHGSGAPKDVLLIDFQGPYYGSPVGDLFYYIISSSSLELKKSTQFDELIQYYQKQLAKGLKKLNYPGAIPSLRDIQIEILKRGFFGMYCLYSILPIVLADKSDNANLAGLIGDDEENHKFRYDLFNNPLFHEHLRSLFKIFDVRGLLEFE